MGTFNHLIDLLFYNLEKHPDKLSFYTKIDGTFQGRSYRKLLTQTESLSMFLQSIGIQANDKVAILATNCPEWVIADMATLSLGGVVVPLYPTLSPAEIQYLLCDSACKLIFVEDQEKHDLMTKILKDCPSITHIVQLKSDAATPKETRLLETCYSDFETDGAFTFLKNACKSVSRDSLASIVYTSGTTGTPKGAMLSHGNFLCNIDDLKAEMPLDDNDLFLSFLPLSHVFERCVGYYAVLSVCGTLYYAESIEKVSENIKECHPTILISVPRVYEKIQMKVYSELKGLKKPIFNWAQKVGYRVSTAKDKRKIPFFLKVQHKIAQKLVYKKVHQKTGGKIRFFVSGGAPLSQELGQFFLNMGLLIVEGYGLTETAPIISCNRVDNFKLGSVGIPLPQVEVSLAKDGEILAKGPNIMKGYYNLPEKTAEVIDQEGWFHTGDIGQIDDAGFIKIIDRKKEIIVLSSGKNVAPLMVEEKIKTSLYISQAMLIGNNRTYITALIVPNMPELESWAHTHGISYDTSENLLENPDMIAFIHLEIKNKCDDFAQFEHIKKFILLDQEWTTEEGELTITLKLKRKVLLEKFKELIEEMYHESVL